MPVGGGPKVCGVVILMVDADKRSWFNPRCIGAGVQSSSALLAPEAVPVVELPVHQVPLHQVNMLATHRAVAAKSATVVDSVRKFSGRRFDWSICRHWAVFLYRGYSPVLRRWKCWG